MINFLFFLFFSLTLFSQRMNNDFSTWFWIQTKYNFKKKNTLNLQFQSRFNQNSTSFDKNNFYLSFERKLAKKVHAEGLYQFSTSHDSDQHTLYAGLTFKIKFKPFVLFYRTAIQHKQNYFSRNPFIDNPFNEWRNRLRLSYSPNEKWTFSISTEPYLFFSNFQTSHFSRIRNVIQSNYSLNPFHSISLFYLLEPTLNFEHSKKNDFVLGLTYQIVIPKKKKDKKHFFDFKPKKEKEEKPEQKDTFN